MITETFSQDLIDAAARAFIRDSGLYDAFDKHKRKDWVYKIRRIDEGYIFEHIWCYKGQEVAQLNLDKLADRAKRGVIVGNGDDR